ncbi:TetR/AcrR family transcriptional regulator [Microbacterium sp. ASV49]|uniref:Helix-turn-helix domain-containing protein n=1 Tax=Microbacterium candidum TaxID=3041922 RepID=A0ABT7N3M1_9MICO|nr:TetR/AcrR family transcriptional regulator [Microbacterium sp. ASV49]MDL9981281.1 helix-turn-helix domain-containing protein [Microbacterium sp. ASV49]
MDDDVKRRPYDSPSRRAKSDATRARIMHAAADLFVAQGYAATSTRTVAAKAGASEASVFANFASKAGLLSSVIVDRVTTDADFPLSSAGAVVAGMPRRAAVAAFARIVRRAHARTWRLLAVGAAAAADDADLAATMRRGAERRLLDIRWFAETVLGAPDSERVAESIWAVAAVEPYRHLIIERVWSDEAYEEWLARMILATVEGTAVSEGEGEVS